jgi:branched-chain amino acid aminotransferase
MEIKISKTTNSRAHEFITEELVFGGEFADHMLICDYKDGQWGTPEISVFVLHYLPCIMDNQFLKV